MDQAQLLRQIEYKLATLTWDDSPNGRIFADNSIEVCEDLDMAKMAILPAVAIADGGFESHPEWSELGWQTVICRIFVEGYGDRRGRGQLLGHGRVAGTSKGAGIKAVTREVIELLKRLEPADGVQQIEAVTMVAPPRRGHQGNMSVMMSEVMLAAFIANDDSYPPALAFAAATGAGGAGTIDLTFTPPKARFDRVGVHIRRATGSAPTDTTSGTAVYTGAASSYQDSGLNPGTTYYYSCWGAYDADYVGRDGAPTTPDTYSTDKLTASAAAAV